MSGQSDITIEIEGAEKIEGLLNRHDIERKILKIWAQRIRTFLFNRYRQYSQGGGDWPPLKTPRRKKAARVKKSDAEQVSIQQFFNRQSILVDTGTLRNALNPRTPGPGQTESYGFRPEGATVTLGFGGEDLHPLSSEQKEAQKKRSKKGKSKPIKQITIAELAAIHHSGCPKNGLPARRILEKPDQKTIQLLIKIAEKEIKKSL